MKCFLFGYNGLGNIGDDLMFKGMLNDLPESMKRYSYKRDYQIGNEIQVGALRAFFLMLTCKEFIIVGGNVFSFERSKSYVKIMSYLILFTIRRVFGLKTIVDSVGLDLKENSLWRTLVLQCLNKCQKVSLRDELSYRYMRAFSKIKSLNYDFDRVYRNKKDLFNQCQKNSCFDNSWVWWVSGPAYRKNSNKIDNISININFEVNVIFFCQEDYDVERAHKIAKEYKIKNYDILYYNFENINECLVVFKSSSQVITERYHGAVIAEAMNVPWLSIPFSEKLKRIKPNKYMI